MLGRGCSPSYSWLRWQFLSNDKQEPCIQLQPAKGASMCNAACPAHRQLIGLALYRFQCLRAFRMCILVEGWLWRALIGSKECCPAYIFACFAEFDVASTEQGLILLVWLRTWQYLNNLLTFFRTTLRFSLSTGPRRTWSVLFPTWRQ